MTCCMFICDVTSSQQVVLFEKNANFDPVVLLLHSLKIT